ncbi:hypothetical protein OH76DRAFT_881660 [Lentinus brumalis]|uniref:Uncharacterized protein n=1 Tax=Lentinus brumalis TaxID=2498619 RepID=A0A371DRT3_9APHY|nr:hypothetical protein OH76DRAFT_881660 [Polyporus brumalis]
MKQIELKQRKHSQHCKPTRVPPGCCTSCTSRTDTVHRTDSACPACHGRIVFVPRPPRDAHLVANIIGWRLLAGHHDAGRARESRVPNIDPDSPAGHRARALLPVVLRVRRPVVFSRRVSGRVLLVCFGHSYLLHELLGHWKRREGHHDPLAEQSRGLLGGVARGFVLLQLLELGGFLLLLQQLLPPLFTLQPRKQCQRR